jgi:hypothetical protein
MALVFFGDPTAPAQCAIEIAAGLKGKPHLKLRMGIHTGPVYRVADVNANANVSGGGINVAQRVMDCGDAGHILVSNTVADVLTQLSDWAPCLCDLGQYPVKHGVKLHIYNLATVDAGNPERPTKLAALVTKAPPKKSKAPIAAAAAVVLLGGGAAGWLAMRPKPEAASPVQPAKPSQVAYKMLRQENKIAFEVTTPGDGYLYILSYGEDAGKWTFNLLDPRHSNSAKRSAGETLRIPPAPAWFQSNTATDKNYPYIVWSRDVVPEVEKLKKLPQDSHGVATAADPAQVAEIQKFLNDHHSKASTNGGEIDIETSEPVLVHGISLEKQ